MSKMMLHEHTEKQVKAFTSQPSHALLLVGPKGSGKFSLAQMLAADVLRVPSVTDYAYGMHIVSKETSIGIEAIRGIEQFLRLKVPGSATYRRLIIIENAEKMTLEAQMHCSRILRSHLTIP